MITGLAKVITNFFLLNGVIEYEDKDIYQYGNEIIISCLFDILIVVVVGLIYNMLEYSILFFISFSVLRSYSGGYHADSYLKCKLIYIINLSLALSIIFYTSQIYGLYLLVLLLLFSILVVWKLAPIENDNKPLSDNDVIINSKRSKITLIILCCSIVLSYKINKCISLSLLLSLLSVAVSMIIEFIRKRRESNEGD